MFLVTEWFGAFLLAPDGTVKAERLFPKDKAALAAVLQRLAQGQVLEEERQLAVRADDELRVREERHRQLPGAVIATDVPTLADRAHDWGFTKQLLHEASIELGRMGVRAASSKRDMHVVQAVDAIDELNEQANIAVERLREWYGLHFPELVDASQRNEEVAALVSAHVTRDAIAQAAPQYAADAADSMGGPLPDPEQKAIRGFARTASSLYATKAELEKYLDEAMVEIAPNVAQLLQPVLAARMIKQAGGLHRLATMPAGTIQTLGAEKALFRHIKEGKRPPKHGFLMQHPLIHRAPRYHRGALARSLAAKVALAARADAFTKSKDSGARLAAEFQQRADELKDKQQRQKGAAKARKARGAGGFRPRTPGGGRR
ncbi:MAG TPA: C/D box methylation guide ribonucleoprotein complex aNOP56 subunit [Candidatus Thermoplasmatota archaeon]|nr:C/D box methylation guide ribonucleoprotein complex aNOP56 subunit [Candidatus Thermoplasmatota archaeon]